MQSKFLNGFIRLAVFRVMSLGLAILALPRSVNAIGWDSDDFLISGGPSFTTMIGVFDHDLTFKGLLDPNFVTVAGMDFDASGRLVAAGAGNARSVRVYDSSGAIVGGFTNTELLANAADLKVTPSGSYVIAANNTLGVSAREFLSQGMLVREYLGGWTLGAAVVPGNRLWLAGVGSSEVRVFDLASGAQTGTMSINGLAGANSMYYSQETNTVLFATIQTGAVLETDLSGNVVHTFTPPSPSGFNGVSRGPNGDVLATATGNQSIFRWNSNGDFLGAVSTTKTLGGVSAIVWAGVVPEATYGIGVTLIVAMCARRTCSRC
jgi:WD40 repeat protein